MTIGIYGIFNKETEECLYVGMSKNIERRKRDHLKVLKSKTHKRQDFVEWYHNNGANPEILDFKVLEECDNNNDILNKLEIEWFNRLQPKYFGKKPSLNEKWEQSEETREKLRKTANSNLKTLVCEFCNNHFQGVSSKRCRKCRNNKAEDKYCVICNNKICNSRRIKYCENCHISTDSKSKIKKYQYSYKKVCEFIECNQIFITKTQSTRFCSVKCSSYNRYYNSDLNKENLEKLYIDQQFSTTQIAEMYNTTAPTVRNSLKRFNIKLRTRTNGVRIARKNGR